MTKRESPARSGWQQLFPIAPEQLRTDALAGMAVAAYLIPQCMAYAEMAGVTPVQGIWACLLPMLIYALVGSSPQLSVGPESTTAVLTAAALAPLADAGTVEYAELCSILALLVGSFCCLGALLRLGALANLLSRPVLTGYLSGVAGIMVTSQMGVFCGLELERKSVWGAWLDLAQRLGEIRPASLLLALSLLLILLALERWRPRWPGPLLAVLLATGIVHLFDLSAMGVAVIGPVPAGLPTLHLPAPISQDLLIGLVPAAVGMALIGYSDNVLTARAFAARNGYRIDADQELIALGAVNLSCALVPAFPISSSGSRTAIADAGGSRTQWFSLMALLVVLLVLLVLHPLLARFPKAALGALVIHAARRLIDVEGFGWLFRFRWSEGCLALITGLGVLFTDILTGVLLGVGLSVADLIIRMLGHPSAETAEMAQLAGLRTTPVVTVSKPRPDQMVVVAASPLCFINAEAFRSSIRQALDQEPHPLGSFILDVGALVGSDSTAIEMVIDLFGELIGAGTEIALVSASPVLNDLLGKAAIPELIGSEHMHRSLEQALNSAKAAEACKSSPAGPDASAAIG